MPSDDTKSPSGEVIEVFRIKLSVDEVKSFLPFHISIHDLGKITPNFVSQALEAMEQVASDDFNFFGLEEYARKNERPPVHFRHERYTFAIAMKLLPDFPSKEALCASLRGHHGV